MTTYFSQQEYTVRCEWGLNGLHNLLDSSDVVVIVDVLSFCTSVDIAVSNGAMVYPYKHRDDSATAYAKSLDASHAATSRDAQGYTLSPASLLNIPSGTRLVLPSLNGSTLSLETKGMPTFAACLRNARAVASAVESIGGTVSLIPAGERWQDDSLRPAIEDLIGAGAIIHHLSGSPSPEALMAEAVYLRFKDELAKCLRQCGSGKELINEGFTQDVELASALNASYCTPMLVNGAYVNYR